MEFLVKYIAVFAVSLAASWIFVPLAKKIAPSLGLVDEPSDRRIHKTPIPRCGGLAVFAATHLGLILIFLGPWKHVAGSTQVHDWGFLFGGSLVLLLVGIFDDRYDMRAWFKLFGQLAVALLMYFGGFTFEAFLMIQFPEPVILLATLFWFVLLMNAFNLIDGMDGACAGLGLIASAGLAGMLLSLRQPLDAMILVALAGACFGFLRYNFNPASIFLGDSGSMFIGFILAAISLKANVKQSMMVALLVPLLAVGVPAFDVMLAVWRRLARKIISMINHDGLVTKVFGPDLDHIHHKLMRSGMTQRKAAAYLYGAAIFLCLLALAASAMSSHQTALLMIGMIVVLHVVVRQLAQVELWTTTQVVLQGVHRPRNVVGMLFAISWDICCLILATFLVFSFFLEHPVTMAYMAICVVTPFATIFFYSVYKTVWTRSRISQILVLFLQLLAGETLAFVALLLVTDLGSREMIIALTLHALAASVGIVGSRASLRIVRDLNAWLRCSIGGEYDMKTMILGAGENAILYLRQASFEDQQKAPRKIIGLIDDNPALHRKMVYGYPVLGRFDELEKMIQKHEINELIFTHHYSDELRASILSLKTKYQLRIRDFIFVLRELDERGLCHGILKPYSAIELDCRNLCSRENGHDCQEPLSATDVPETEDALTDTE